MPRSRKRYQRPGTAPGTLSPPDPRVPKVTVTIMDYDADSLEERKVEAITECLPYRTKSSVTWIDVNGLQDVELIRQLGAQFGLHPLSLEDVLNTGQRPKFEDYEEYCFVIMKELRVTEGIEAEQISLFFGPGWVITLQEAPGDPFEPVRERLRKGKGRIRKSGADYLAYALIDALVDGAFPILEKLGDRIETLERDVVGSPTRKTVSEIYSVRRELLYLRRTAWPQRELIHALNRDESALITPDTRIYLRDCYDHSVQILDLVETYRELAAGMLDVYLSGASNRLNEVMKVLTVIATIFIPLTFITSLYGMNFNTAVSRWNMPELNWPLGYPMTLAVMAAVVAGMLYYFRRKKWL
jgi:magnesium transporter